MRKREGASLYIEVLACRLLLKRAEQTLPQWPRHYLMTTLCRRGSERGWLIRGWIHVNVHLRSFRFSRDPQPSHHWSIDPARFFGCCNTVTHLFSLPWALCTRPLLSEAHMPANSKNAVLRSGRQQYCYQSCLFECSIGGRKRSF